MQINIGHLGEDGVFNGAFTTFALAGNVRAMVSCTEITAQYQMNGGFIHSNTKHHALTSSILSFCLQGNADSAVDTLWKEKSAVLKQDS